MSSEGGAAGGAEITVNSVLHLQLSVHPKA